MPKSESKMPPSNESGESLVSSDSLPEFADVEKRYREAMASIEAEQEKDKPKGKRGKKAQIEEETTSETTEDTGEALQVSPEDIEEWIAFPLNVYFSRIGKPQLNRYEKLSLSRTSAKVLNKYLPMIAAQYGAEIGLGICLATIFAVRMKPPEVKEKEPEPKKETPAETVV